MAVLNYFNIYMKVLEFKSQTIIFPSHEELKSCVSLLLNVRDVTFS